MSLKVTAKGYHDLSVNGVHFSNHSSMIEAVAERASAILQANPSLVVTVRPPVIEIRASEASVAVPPAVPVTSDGGEDLIDFLERTSGPEYVVATISAKTVWDAQEAFTLETLKHKGPLRFRTNLVPGGPKLWVGWGWRGYIFTWYHRDKSAIQIGG